MSAGGPPYTGSGCSVAGRAEAEVERRDRGQDQPRCQQCGAERRTAGQSTQWRAADDLADGVRLGHHRDHGRAGPRVDVPVQPGGLDRVRRGCRRSC